mgnify:CR=1 FL=1
MNTQTFAQTQNIAPITDEELMAATGGIAFLPLLIKGGIGAAKAAGKGAAAYGAFKGAEYVTGG